MRRIGPERLSRVQALQFRGAGLGEIEGLRVSMAGAGHKLGQIGRSSSNMTTVDLGLPTARNEES